MKITNAVARLEQNLPLRGNQQRLPGYLRRFHQSILRYFLESGKAPAEGDIDFSGNWEQAIVRLATEKIILLDRSGAIAGAYPFAGEARDFRVTSEHGEVRAMCAFDALAVSSMFALPTRIESRCRISGCQIVIEQNDTELHVIKPDMPVFGAIDWDARDSTMSCSDALCSEMFFIAGAENAANWLDENPNSRELFSLGEAHEFIATVFLPLMAAGQTDQPGN